MFLLDIGVNIVSIFCTVNAIFNVKYLRDLEIWVIVRGHSRSLKLVPFKSLGTVFYSLSIVTMAVSVTVFEIVRVV